MGTDARMNAAKMSPDICSYPAILGIFKEPLQVPIFSSIKDAPLFFSLSNFIHSKEKYSLGFHMVNTYESVYASSHIKLVNNSGSQF